MKIHIIGIAGKTSAAVAKMLTDLGHEVTGSDQGCYPPMTDFLDSLGIVYKTPYDENNLPDDVDYVIVAGNALIINPNNPEYLKAKKLEVPIKPYSKVLQDFVIKENSIVVAGNYGKGTISGAITKALVDLGVNPSYMVSGLMEDLEDNLKSTDSMWSVVEGDEYFDPPIGDEPPRSKFFNYNPKYLVLTSAEWDHFDKFPTQRDYIDNYKELVKTLPSDGLLVANYDGENLKEIIKEASCNVVTYSLVNPHADYVGDELLLNPALLGRFNHANLTAAYAMLAELGFDTERVLHSLNHYRGLKQRMTVLYEDDQTVLVRDLAHSPVKAKAAISAAKEVWPDKKIVAVLEIVATSLKDKSVLTRLHGALDGADQVFIPRVKLGAYMDREKVATGKEIVEAIKETQPNVEYVAKIEDLATKVLKVSGPKVILLMSSGGMNGLDKELLEKLQ